jgi:ribonuclease P protein component
MTNEAHVSAQSNQAQAQARLPKPHEHQGGAGNFEPPPGEGARASHGLGGLEAGLRMMSSARFRLADRIVSARDYARIRRRGRRVSSKNFAVSIAPVGGPETPRGGVKHPSNTRLGLSVSRRVGNAVVRNRVKRAVRAWFRTSRDGICGGEVDIVVIARRGARDQQVCEIADELNQLFSKIAAASPVKSPKTQGLAASAETGPKT